MSDDEKRSWRWKRFKQKKKERRTRKFSTTKMTRRNFNNERISLNLIDHQSLLSEILNRVKNIIINWSSEFIIKLIKLTSIKWVEDVYVNVNFIFVTCLINYKCLLSVEKLNRVRNIFKLKLLSTEFIIRLTDIDENNNNDDEKR